MDSLATEGNIIKAYNDDEDLRDFMKEEYTGNESETPKMGMHAWCAINTARFPIRFCDHEARCFRYKNVNY